MIVELNEFLRIKEVWYNKEIALTSGGFDPIHSGHINCLIKSKIYCDTILAVLVNDDEFLLNKKGYSFLAHDERMRIVDAIKGVDYVIPWHEQNVATAIWQIKPNYFTKGGDRSSLGTVDKDEVYACRMTDCHLLLGIGGDEKANSSSWIINNFIEKWVKKPGVLSPTTLKETVLEGNKT